MFHQIINQVGRALARWSYHRRLFHFDSEAARRRLCARDDDDIDHIVSLRNAWECGAATWTPERRLAFANDTGNLWPLQRELNEAKGDRTLAEFDEALRKRFSPAELATIAEATRYIKVRYSLDWSEGERAAVITELNRIKARPASKTRCR